MKMSVLNSVPPTLLFIWSIVWLPVTKGSAQQAATGIFKPQVALQLDYLGNLSIRFWSRLAENGLLMFRWQYPGVLEQLRQFLV